jgi:hypothetical protein
VRYRRAAFDDYALPLSAMAFIFGFFWPVLWLLAAGLIGVLFLRLLTGQA